MNHKAGSIPTSSGWGAVTAHRPVPTHVASLRRGFTGQIMLPEDDGYDQARRVWNAMADRRRS